MGVPIAAVPIGLQVASPFDLDSRALSLSAMSSRPNGFVETALPATP
jgi:hypothetical protein